MPEPVINLILLLLDLYQWVVIIAVVVSWLIAFGIINTYNDLARSAIRILNALTEPVFRQIRRVVPAVGGLDLSPLIVLIGIWFLQQMILWLAQHIAI